MKSNRTYLILLGGILSLLGTYVFCWYSDGSHTLSGYSLFYIVEISFNSLNVRNIWPGVIALLSASLILIGLRFRFFAILFGLITIFFSLCLILAFYEFDRVFSWFGVDFIIPFVEPSIGVNFPIGGFIGNAFLGNYFTLTGGILGTIGGFIKKPKKVRQKEKIIQTNSNVSQTEIQLVRGYEHLSGKIQIKLKVVNSSQLLIAHVRASLHIPESFRLLRTEPSEYKRDGSTIILHELGPGEAKTTSYILEPLICGKVHFNGIITWNDAYGQPQSLIMEPMIVETRCPMFVRPEEVSRAAVEQIMSGLSVKSDRTYILPKKSSDEVVFTMAKNIVSEHDVTHVGDYTTNLTNQEGNMKSEKSSWYYGVTKIGQKPYVITVSLSEHDKILRFSTYCNDVVGCTGFLAEIGAKLRKEMVKTGAVDSEDAMKELLCENCGFPLPKWTSIEQSVVCLECKHTWEYDDFYKNE